MNCGEVTRASFGHGKRTRNPPATATVPGTGFIICPGAPASHIRVCMCSARILYLVSACICCIFGREQIAKAAAQRSKRKWPWRVVTGTGTETCPRYCCYSDVVAAVVVCCCHSRSFIKIPSAKSSLRHGFKPEFTHVSNQVQALHSVARSSENSIPSWANSVTSK